MTFDITWLGRRLHHSQYDKGKRKDQDQHRRPFDPRGQFPELRVIVHLELFRHLAQVIGQKDNDCHQKGRSDCPQKTVFHANPLTANPNPKRKEKSNGQR